MTAPTLPQALPIPTPEARAEAAAERDREWIAAARDDAERDLRRRYAGAAAVLRARALREGSR